ncbi:hypothetical protein G7074_25805 [Pedobacter sp. HDW13]|uniref:hypothetical protein n=1 Tax=Pedobacter sp. HDW13 TaxID=2714940 RepID=UPI00140D91A0|nr:hypothetical protein [Pedobacter sp. HDW13]QIL42374.1 hypothetical protein G7074_25805 [Pedobacter sp. HDW13]
MKTIEYFKLQAKNLYKDFKTQKPYFDPSLGNHLFEYTPKFFDVDALVTDFDIDEGSFTLMNAQHIIAKLVGFKKWTEMLKASMPALELARLLFDNQHKISYEEWVDYFTDIENENNVILDDEYKLDIFKQVFADVDGHDTYVFDYRLVRMEKPSNENQIIKPKKIEEKMKTTVQISALPLVGADRNEFIEVANAKFEDVLDRIEAENPQLTRKLWNAEKYIDEELLTPDMLPIGRDYALSLVDAFLVNYVIGLAVQADEQAAAALK